MKRSTKLPTITRQELTRLEASGRCVYVYPRIKEASVDGFKRYRIVNNCAQNYGVVGKTTTVVKDTTE